MIDEAEPLTEAEIAEKEKLLFKNKLYIKYDI